MALSIFAIINIILFIIAIVAIAFVVYVFNNSRKEEDDNNDIVLNFISHESNKRFLGSYIREEDSVPGRKIIYYKPKGLDLRSKKFNAKEIREKVKPQDAIVDPEKRITIPKGILEADKAIHLLMPPQISDIPKAVQETPIGKMVIWAMLEENNKKTIQQMLEHGRLDTSEILKKIGDGELTREWQERIQGIMQDSLAAVVHDYEKKDKPRSVNVSSGGLPHGQNA